MASEKDWREKDWDMPPLYAELYARNQQLEQQLAQAERILTLLEGNSHIKFDVSTGKPLGRCVFCHFLFDLFSMKEEGPHHPLCPIGALHSYRETYPRTVPLQEEINALIQEQSNGK